MQKKVIYFRGAGLKMQENDKPANEKIVECISTAEDTNAESRLTCQQIKAETWGHNHRINNLTAVEDMSHQLQTQQ